MKILVTVKRIPDPEQKLKIEQQKLHLLEAQWQLNQFDEYALESALRLTENAESPQNRLGEVVVVSIGNEEVKKQLRTALAMGADRALLVKGNEDELDANIISRCLEELVKREKPDLVLMGKISSDHEGNEVGQRLAAYLNWPQATFVSTIQKETENSLKVGREVDDGLEVKRLSMPCVLTVDLRVIAPHAVQNGVTPATYEYPEGARYASLRGVKAASVKVIPEFSLQDLGVSVDRWVEYVQAELPPKRKSGVRVNSAAELVEKLHQEAKVL